MSSTMASCHVRCSDGVAEVDQEALLLVSRVAERAAGMHTGGDELMVLPSATVEFVSMLAAYGASLRAHNLSPIPCMVDGREESDVRNEIAHLEGVKGCTPNGAFGSFVNDYDHNFLNDALNYMRRVVSDLQKEKDKRTSLAKGCVPVCSLLGASYNFEGESSYCAGMPDETLVQFFDYASHLDAPLFQLLLVRRYYANQNPTVGMQASLTSILFYFNNADDDDGNFTYNAVKFLELLFDEATKRSPVGFSIL